MPASPTSAALAFDRSGDGTLVFRLSGAWRLGGSLPALNDVQRQLEQAPPRRVTLDGERIEDWDTGLLTFVERVVRTCEERGIHVDRSRLPAGAQRLLGLAEAVPERRGARGDQVDEPLLEIIGKAALSAGGALREMLQFLGEVTIAFGQLLRGRARFRRSDLMVLIRQAGAEALPIVTLISFLVGAILAFVGAVQLQQFGAAIYVADLVGIAMVREMGAMMTAIVMAGRTGASYAAQLGSMKVTQEIDALTTMGISPLEFLVVPRMLALFLMMPVLCVYSNFVGILGGAAVGLGMLDLPAITYAQETQRVVTLTHFFGGIFKAAVYGILIGFAGCLRGIQTGGSSSAVGESTTRAVVTSIVLVIGACGIFAVLFYIIGI